MTIYQHQRLNSDELVPWRLFQVLDGRKFVGYPNTFYHLHLLPLVGKAQKNEKWSQLVILALETSQVAVCSEPLLLLEDQAIGERLWEP